MATGNELLLLLEEALSQKKSDFEVSKIVKNEIKSYFGSLEERFELDGGKSFLVSHTRTIDGFITPLFKYLLREYFGDYVPSIHTIPIALVALGSYGREQLTLYSDIDLMIVYKDTKGYNLSPMIEKFVMLLWDTGLKLGHRVHEIGELVDVSQTDITIKTAILESRFLYGSRFLWTEVENQLTAIRREQRVSYIIQKWDEYQARHKKYPLSMEPNIKDGFGALRDAHTLFWVATAHFGVKSNRELIGKIFSDEEYREYRTSLEFLFKVRTALHLVAKKKQDQLIMQYQRDVAFKLGFKDTPTLKAERQLVAKTTSSMMSLYRFTSFYIYTLTRRPYVVNECVKKSEFRLLSEGIFEHKGALLCSKNFGKQTLSHVLKTLLTLPDVSFKSAPTLVWALSKSKMTPFNDVFRKTISKIFLRKNSYDLLKLFYDAGVIDRLIPPFGKILYLAQFDGYHHYPVDTHSLQALKSLETLHEENLLSLWENLDPKEKLLLKLVVLLHDAGKGRKGDHSEIGAKLFKPFALSLGVDETLVEMGVTLIRYHTHMSNVALREDIYSDKTVLAFASLFGNKKMLDMIYLLTVADIKGVGGSVYTSFTANLLRDLHSRAYGVIDRKELVSEAQTRLYREGLLKKNSEFLAFSPPVQKKILGISSTMLFIKNKSDVIVGLAKRVIETKELRVDVSNDPHFTIEIFSKVEINLGWLLSKFTFLDIAQMDIYKLFDGVKYIKVSYTTSADEHVLENVQAVVEKSRDMSLVANFARPVITKKELSLDPDHSLNYAAIRLETKNQRGLIALFIEVLDRYKIDIASAKVSTVKNRVRDLFLIEKSGSFIKYQKTVMKELVTPKEK